MEQFKLLAKSARGAAAVQLIDQALGASGVNVFSEFICLPNIQDLANSEDSKRYWDALNLFAFGTYKDYLAQRALLPPLSDLQLHKLRLLTIVSLASHAKRIPYSTLLSELGISNVRELEDLVIEAVYGNLVQGKLDQCNQCLEVDVCMGRDVQPGDIAAMNTTLCDLSTSCQGLLLSLEEHMLDANKRKMEALSSQKRVDQELDSVKKTLKLTGLGPGRTAMPSVDIDDAMPPDISSSSQDEKKKEKRTKGGLRGSAKFWKS